MKFEIQHYPLTIREYHLDTFGHVNNAMYLQILEEARWEFITSRGFGMEKILKSGVGPIILEINMKFLKEMKLRQKVVIESETLAYDKKIGFLRQDILDENKNILFQAKLTFGLFDTSSRKLIPPTSEWLKAVGFVD